MDITSPHFPYVIAAYLFGGSILALLACWTCQADRKARQQLARWTSDGL